MAVFFCVRENATILQIRKEAVDRVSETDHYPQVFITTKINPNFPSPKLYSEGLNEDYGFALIPEFGSLEESNANSHG